MQPISRNYFDDSQYSTSEIIEKEFTFTWKIKGYESLSKMEIGSSVSSVSSSIGKETPWYILFYPNGKENNNWMSVRIAFNFNVPDSFQCPSYKWSACLIDKWEKEVYVEESLFTKCKNYNFYTVMNFATIEYFVSKMSFNADKDKLLNNDTLTLRCKIYIPLERKLKDPAIVKQSKFIGFENMLNKQEFSDVKIDVGSQVIFVYKGILATKSPVFAAMFAHNMQKNNKNVVHISDVNYNIMHEMLYFMYTGKVKNIQLVAKDLLMAADKYEVEDLKFMCEEALACNLNIGTVIVLLIFAEKHTAKTLKECALDYIKSNLKELIRTKKFEADLNSLPSSLSLLDIMKAIM